MPGGGCIVSVADGASTPVRPDPDPSDPAARRDLLALDARLRALSELDRDVFHVATAPGFTRWLEQIHSIGGCAQPVYLSGHTTRVDAATGEILSAYSTAGEPGERLAVRCGNRRARRCPTCSRLYQGDTFYLVRAGLSGGKGLPDSVAGHTRLFVTLTAPSFGRVHRATSDGRACRPQRRTAICPHGRTTNCQAIHDPDDALVGSPLCPACYDYTGQVLWHAHAGRLWNRFTDQTRRAVATAAGLPRSRLREHVIVSFAKVAEYQKRGAVHFHAVVRLDGPDGPASAPPAWASALLLEHCVRHAAAAVWVEAPPSAAYGDVVLRWGEQLDVRPIGAFPDGQALRDDAVAGYVAKYVTKSAELAGAVDYPITSAGEIAHLAVSGHVRALIGMCWRLGGLAELEHLRLRAWAHMLGYGGHCLTKSVAYSTTYGELRAARAGTARPSCPPAWRSSPMGPGGTWDAATRRVRRCSRVASPRTTPPIARSHGGKWARTGGRDDRKVGAQHVADLARHGLVHGWVGGARRVPRGADRVARLVGAEHGR
ncbi:replication initiator [Kitasatospora acidiphila]|uniref:replication initiator n=1 Tax=Kitasatospora acidiphila TaxID=2567942 RepID=UPI002B3FFD40|nr:replication initiator [Kitasatospora acidiphila]